MVSMEVAQHFSHKWSANKNHNEMSSRKLKRLVIPSISKNDKHLYKWNIFGGHES